MAEWKLFAIDEEPPAGTSRGGQRDIVVTLFGGALIAIGAYLPWLQANPRYEPSGLHLVPSLMTPGVELIHFVLLFPAGVVLAALVVNGPTRGWALVSLVTGLWAVLFSVLLLVVQYTSGTLRFIPELGWVLTVLGGLLLALVGGLALFREETTESQRRI